MLEIAMCEVLDRGRRVLGNSPCRTRRILIRGRRISVLEADRETWCEDDVVKQIGMVGVLLVTRLLG